MTVKAQKENAPQLPSVAELVDELFSEIQMAQGYAHFSDGAPPWSHPEFFARVRGQLRWSEKATKIMRTFLKKYDQEPKVGRPLRNSPPVDRKPR